MTDIIPVLTGKRIDTRGDIHTHVATQSVHLTFCFKPTHSQWKNQLQKSKTVSKKVHHV